MSNKILGRRSWRSALFLLLVTKTYHKYNIWNLKVRIKNFTSFDFMNLLDNQIKINLRQKKATRGSIWYEWPQFGASVALRSLSSDYMSPLKKKLLENFPDNIAKSGFLNSYSKIKTLTMRFCVFLTFRNLVEHLEYVWKILFEFRILNYELHSIYFTPFE